MTPLRLTLALALLAAAAQAQARYHLDDVVLTHGTVATGSFVYLPVSGYGDVDIVTSDTTGTRLYFDALPQASDQVLFVVNDASLPDLQDKPTFLAPLGGTLGVDPIIDMDVAALPNGETECATFDCGFVYVFPFPNELVSGRVILLGEAWTNLGGSLAGASGAPALRAQGGATPGASITLGVFQGASLATAYWVIGVGLLQAPFKGGTLVPTLDVLTPLPLDANGEIEFSFSWPAGVPSGLATYHQVWMPDATGPAGFIASNAISAMTP